MRAVGEHAWLLEFRDADERQANARARAAAGVLAQTMPEGLLDVVPAARTLYVAGTPSFDPGFLDALEGTPAAASGASGTLHSLEMIPDGMDLLETAAALSMSRDAFLTRFLGLTFIVGFLGFSPGFAYLYGLPEMMSLPRRRTPRTSVPRGSVAMAGRYASIYPSATPGGWNLIGTSRTRLFDPSSARPALLSPGDRVKFVVP